MGNLVTTAVITDIANCAAAKQSYCERAASRSSSFISPSPSALRLVAGRLTVHENSRHLEVDRRGPAPVEVCEQWLLASPKPFTLISSPLVPALHADGLLRSTRACLAVRRTMRALFTIWTYRFKA